MTSNSKLMEATAPCGIDCFNCQLFGDNIHSAPIELIERIETSFPGKLPCRGCRINGCPLTPAGCETRICVLGQGHDFCFRCENFPCSRLSPVAEGAQIYPHNLKLYNLMRIRSRGLEKWAREASANRDAYFKGKFSIGTGPVTTD